ncbi:DUF6082 family protein [Streptomyces hokutonensis]|uniref:DUF6082 family protein n=1 Tax=Streptomyces hokutonensis TaxID=1306990 RepID=UPI0003623934|nr:DUF6082 family protein [Streptomyces hokutonensis]
MATENSDGRRNDSAGGDGAGGLEPLVRELLRQVASLAEELRNANLIQLHRIAEAQTDRAIADPLLAEAMSTLPDPSGNRRRQLLFANMQYAKILLNHRVGAIGRDELLGHLRVLCRNLVFQEYWELTRDHRKSLPRESLEATVGRAVDAIMDELRDDPDEWWVVGPDTEPT